MTFDRENVYDSVYGTSRPETNINRPSNNYVWASSLLSDQNMDNNGYEISSRTPIEQPLPGSMLPVPPYSTTDLRVSHTMTLSYLWGLK